MTYEILVQPLGYLPAELLYSIVAELNSMFKGLTFRLCSEQKEPPVTAYDWRRRQYYSPHVIEYVYKQFKDFINDNDNILIACISDIDAYSDNLNFVFGEAVPHLRTCCVYTRRLRNEFYGLPADTTKFYLRIIKEVIHEVGHLLGLGHCNNTSCVMRFSNSLFEVDLKKPYFCHRCKTILRDKGIIQLINDT